MVQGLWERLSKQNQRRFARSDDAKYGTIGSSFMAPIVCAEHTNGKAAGVTMVREAGEPVRTVRIPTRESSR
jgi:hypothetical protein